MTDADVARLRKVYQDRYEAWLVARERQDQALKAFHHAFNVLLEAEVASARNDGLATGGVVDPEKAPRLSE